MYKLLWLSNAGVAEASAAQGEGSAVMREDHARVTAKSAFRAINVIEYFLSHYDGVTDEDFAQLYYHLATASRTLGRFKTACRAIQLAVFYSTTNAAYAAKLQVIEPLSSVKQFHRDDEWDVYEIMGN